MIKKLKELLERDNHQKTRKFFLENLLQSAVMQMGIGLPALDNLKTQRSGKLIFGEFTAGNFQGEYFYLPESSTGMAWLHNSTALKRFRLRPISESEALSRLAGSASRLPASFVPNWPVHPGWLQGRGSKSHWGRG